MRIHRYLPIHRIFACAHMFACVCVLLCYSTPLCDVLTTYPSYGQTKHDAVHLSIRNMHTIFHWIWRAHCDYIDLNAINGRKSTMIISHIFMYAVWCVVAVRWITWDGRAFWTILPKVFANVHLSVSLCVCVYVTLCLYCIWFSFLIRLSCGHVFALLGTFAIVGWTFNANWMWGPTRHKWHAGSTYVRMLFFGWPEFVWFWVLFFVCYFCMFLMSLRW